MQRLTGPVQQGITHREFNSQMQRLQMAALRRAGKSLKESRQLPAPASFDSDRLRITFFEVVPRITDGAACKLSAARYY